MSIRKARLLLLMPTLMLVSCFELLPNENSSSSIDETTTITSDTSISSETQTSDEDEYYWNEEVDANLKLTIGDFICELPVFEAESYTSSNQTSDVYYTFIDCSTLFDSSFCFVAYKSLLMQNNFEISTLSATDNVYMGYKSVSLENVLVVEYRFYKFNDDPVYNHFCIYTYLYKDKTESWPTSEISSVLGEDIPHISAPYYQIQVTTYNGVELFQLGCFGIGSESEDEYYNILKQAGYVVRASSSYYNAVHNAKLINLDFLYDTDNQCLIIQGYKLSSIEVWPEDEIKQLFGFDLPVYVDDAISYYHGQQTFQYLLDDGGFGYVQHYTVECDYAPSSCLLMYDGQLKAAGWSVDDSDLPNDWPLFICSDGHFERYKMTDSNGDHSIEVRYYDPSDANQSGYDLSYPIMLIIIYK